MYLNSSWQDLLMIGFGVSGKEDSDLTHIICGGLLFPEGGDTWFFYCSPCLLARSYLDRHQVNMYYVSAVNE